MDDTTQSVISLPLMPPTATDGLSTGADRGRTVNVALNPPEEYDGGRLLLLHKGRVQAAPRNKGEATVRSRS